MNCRIGATRVRARAKRPTPTFDRLEDRVVPAVIAVDLLADAGAGSLRAAIERANADPDFDTILFATGLAGTISLSSPLPELATPIDLIGPGASAVTVARVANPGTPEYRIFAVAPGAQVRIAALTIAGGLAESGGGVFNAGTLSLANAVVRGNVARVNGGGIANAGTLALEGTIVEANAAVQGGGLSNVGGTVRVAASGFGSNVATRDGGGGISNVLGDLAIAGSWFADNRAENPDFRQYADGGAIASLSGTLLLAGSTLQRNVGVFCGGLLNLAGNATVVGTTFEDHQGEGIRNAGGLLALADTAIVRGTDSGLTNLAASRASGSRVLLAENAGGGLFNGDSTLDLAGSAVVGNGEFGIRNVAGSATIADAVIRGNRGYGVSNFQFGSVTIAGATVLENRGGISNDGGRMTVSGSAIVGNVVPAGGYLPYGGGLFNGNPSVLTLVDSTVSGNAAEAGGGLFNQGQASIVRSTIVGNAATIAGGGVYTAHYQTTSAIGSIIAANAGGNVFNDPPFPGLNLPNSVGTFASLGFNLFDDTPLIAPGPGDLLATDPRLGSLADNGGPTPTHAPLRGSPIIDAGGPVGPGSFDQRGVPRPQGAAADIGAFEVVDRLFVRVESARPILPGGGVGSVTATVLGPDVRPLAGVPVAFQVVAGPDAGAAGVLDPADGRTGSDGRIVFSIQNLGGLGTDTILAQAIPPSGPPIDAPAATITWSTLTVTNTADAGSGSLRAAIQLANADPGPDTISFAPGLAGTIALASALPPIAAPLTLAGPGAGTITIGRAPTAPAFGILAVGANVEVVISGLTIADGLADYGGGITSAGRLTLRDMAFRNNSARVSGGAVDNFGGDLTVLDSGFEGLPDAGLAGSNSGGGVVNRGGTVRIAGATFANHGSRGVGGGAYNQSGAMSITSSRFVGNSATLGAAIHNGMGTMTIEATTVEGNASGIGPAVRNDGTMTIARSIIRGNPSGGVANTYGAAMTIVGATIAGNGNGGVQNFEGARLTVLHSAIVDNTGDSGAGLENSGFATVAGSIVARNAARFTGGGIHNRPSFSIPIRGGISTTPGGSLRIVDSTIFGNTAGQAGGGIWNGHVLAIVNSTISGNSAPLGGGLAHDGRGSDPGAVGTIEDTTFASNAADAGGAVAVLYRPARPGRLTTVASLYSGGPGGNLAVMATLPDGDLAPGSAGFESLGHNLFSDRPPVATLPTDLVATEPRLAPLAANGGPTPTHALLPGSPAIDAGTALPGIATDQRGVPRPWGSAPDIGAFEFRPSSDMPPTPPLPQPQAGPPELLSLVREGVHRAPTRLVLTFRRPLDPSRASDPANYRLEVITPRRSLAVRLRSATYDPADRTVVLAPTRRLPLHGIYRLTVAGRVTGSDGSIADAVTRFGPEAWAGRPAGPLTHFRPQKADRPAQCR